jgi:viroplasmin and RNaseH domain-containing protein
VSSCRRPECQAQIKDFKGAQYKKFDTIEEAEKFLGFDLSMQLKVRYCMNLRQTSDFY